MRKQDIENAFGRAPDDFNEMVEQIMYTKNQSRGGARYATARAVLIAFALVLLLCGTALAITQGLGVLDFQKNTFTNNGPLPEAGGLVVDLANVPGTESPLVTYQMHDAVVDGDRFMITLEATLKTPDTHFFMGGTDSWLDLSKSSGTDLTYQQIAEQTGKTAVQVSPPHIEVDGIGSGGTFEDSITDDGRLMTYIELRGLKLDTSKPLTIQCRTIDREVYGAEEFTEGETSGIRQNEGERYETTSTFEMVAKVANRDALHFEGPFECERMTVHAIDLVKTPLSIYLTLEYTVHESLTAEDEEAMTFMFFNIMQSADDTDFPETGGGGSTEYLTEIGPNGELAGVLMREETMWDPMTEWPETIYLRPYYKLLGEWGEAIVLNTGEAQ